MKVRKRAQEMQAARRARAARLAADPQLAPHGKQNTYLNWGCRCTPCREAHAAAAAKRDTPDR